MATFLLGGLIAGLIGAGIGLGTAIYKDVKEDGIWFNGYWTDYVRRILGWFIAIFGMAIRVEWLEFIIHYLQNCYRKKEIFGYYY